MLMFVKVDNPKSYSGGDNKGSSYNLLTYLEKEVGGIDGEISKQIAQQSAKWTKYKKEERIGILTEEQKGVQFSRIINSLLEIVGELQEG